MEKYTRLNFKNYYSKFRGDNNLCATFFCEIIPKSVN